MASCYLSMHRMQDLLQKTEIIWQQRENRNTRFFAILAHFSNHRYSFLSFLNSGIKAPSWKLWNSAVIWEDSEVERREHYTTLPVSNSLTQAKFCWQLHPETPSDAHQQGAAWVGGLRGAGWGRIQGQHGMAAGFESLSKDLGSSATLMTLGKIWPSWAWHALKCHSLS